MDERFRHAALARVALPGGRELIDLARGRSNVAGGRRCARPAAGSHAARVGCRRGGWTPRSRCRLSVRRRARVPPEHTGRDERARALRHRARGLGRRDGSTSPPAAPSPIPAPGALPNVARARSRGPVATGFHRQRDSRRAGRGSIADMCTPRPEHSTICRPGACACCTMRASATTRHACCAWLATPRGWAFRSSRTPPSWPRARWPHRRWTRFRARGSAPSCGSRWVNRTP